MPKRKLLFTAPVLTASGYGTHARQLLEGIVRTDRYDVYVESLRWGKTPFLQDASLEWIRKLAAKAPPPQPDVHVHVSIPNEFKRRAPVEVGVTAGIEVDRVSPEWLLKCNSEVDFVVVPSQHSRTAFGVEYQGSNGQKLRLERPIFVVPEGVDPTVYRATEPTPSTLLNSLGVPDKNFVFVGLGLDKPQGRDRKNVTRLVEYFCKAFKGSQDVGLVLKASIVNGSVLDFENCKKRIDEIREATGFPEAKVFLIHGRLSDEQMVGVYNDPRVIASVSLTHGEGYGLPLIEAAACDLPVVATDWSGHLDFLTIDEQKLFVPIEYDLTEVYPECVWPGVIEAGTKWAVPREADAVTKLQKMVVSSATPRAWARRLGESVRGNLSLTRVQDTFNDLLAQACVEADRIKPQAGGDRGAFVKALREQVSAKGPSLIYTMPMSAGDVFLSTGVIKALRRKHPGHRVYFATQGRYFDIVRDLRVDGTLLIDEVLEYQQWMQDVGVLEDVFDWVYTPNLAVQMVWANWIRGGRGRNMLDEFAAQCNVHADEPVLPVALDGQEPLASVMSVGTWVAVHSGGQKSARGYAYWTDLVRNVRLIPDVRVVQVGASDDIPVGDVDLDLRGKTDHQALCQVLASCKGFMGIDSYPMHVAAVGSGLNGMAVVALFGSSYPHSTGPRKQRIGLRLIETADRNGCDRACYKDVCRVDAGNPCINNISPQRVYEQLCHAISVSGPKYAEHRPRVGGYIHLLNPMTHGYPFIQSIKSMLGFCVEVIVIDGGSTDGSREAVEALGDLRVKVIVNQWDADEPGMDGMQKAFGRAMASPDCEFLWQQDADEVVHEDDYDRVIDLCRRFPTDVNVVHLPVIELWGDDRTVRTDRHSWKWRLSRNDLRVTHGINVHARQVDPKTGRVFSKPGQSDGCEYIDIVTGDFLPHRGFYNAELERLRKEDPEEYGKQMNQVFGKLPSVWHYSWADLPRKVRNFRDFWDRQWNVLHQTQNVKRFPDVVTDFDVDVAAEQLRQRGGEHGPAATFALTREPPETLKTWLTSGPGMKGDQ